MPNLTSITPVFVAQGADTNATLVGTRFASPMTVNAGAGITSSNVNVTSPALATATLTASTRVGPRNITVTTPEGVSADLFGWCHRSIAHRGQPEPGRCRPRIALGIVRTGSQLPAAYTSASSHADVYKITVPDDDRCNHAAIRPLQSSTFAMDAAGPGL
jgi:hypothetical protein